VKPTGSPNIEVFVTCWLPAKSITNNNTMAWLGIALFYSPMQQYRGWMKREFLNE
jgi:hypothetical protein